jgi:hypothetical protein
MPCVRLEILEAGISESGCVDTDIDLSYKIKLSN